MFKAMLFDLPEKNQRGLGFFSAWLRVLPRVNCRTEITKLTLLLKSARQIQLQMEISSFPVAIPREHKQR